MLHNVKNNPFTGIFQKHYEKLISNNLSKDIATTIQDFMTIDDEEIIHDITNELGNILTVYTSKLKNERVQALTLLIAAPEDEYFIPSVVLSSAYESYSINKTYSSPIHPLLPETDNLCCHLSLGKNLFSQYGGCDIDIISDMLFDIISLPNMAESELFKNIQTLVIIKILEVLFNSCSLVIKGERFKKLPKNHPFAFFAHLDDQEHILIATDK